MIRRAISTGVILLGLTGGPALAQTAMDVMGGMAVQEQEQAAAGAAAGSRSIGGAPVDGGPAALGAPPVSAAALAADRGRDPFRPFTLDLRPDTAEGEPLTPLQRYEIPQLRLAGVVLDLRPPRAMLQDNSGMGFIITPGTPIGRRRGVVKSIEPKRVIIEEHVLDYYGREQVHQVAIEMPKDDKPQGTGE